MNNLTLRLKKLVPNAVVPAKAHETDAGLDLTVTSIESSRVGSNNGTNTVYHFGIAVEIPPGHFGLIVPRSSVYKKDQILSNSCGIIDSSFRGELKAIFKDVNSGYNKYQVGERAAQLIVLPYPQVSFEVVDELSETPRGVSGWGSTGS